MANAIINVGSTGGQINISTAAAPATPAAGVVTLYAGTDKALHVKNSDGTDITIAAAGAASPITVVQTNSLVSTAVGATASKASSVVIGLNASSGSTGSIVIGMNSCAPAPTLADGSLIVIGQCSCLTGQYGSGIAIGCKAVGNSYASIVIGPEATASNEASVALGQLANSGGLRSVAIGAFSCSSTASSIAIGNTTKSQAACSVAIGNTACSTAVFALTIGSSSCSTAACSTTIGTASQVFPGATGTMVLGNSSVGGTGACNSVVIGNNQGKNSTLHSDSILIGLDSCILNYGNPNCLMAGNIAIGKGTKICSSGCGNDNIAIGTNATTCGSASFNSISIGTNASTGRFNSVSIGTSASSTGLGSVAIGQSATVGGEVGVSIGYGSSAVSYSIAMGESSVASGGRGAAIGNQVQATGTYTSIAMGRLSIASGACSIAMGAVACATCNGSIVLGNSITSVKNDTTHVQSLIAYGQAASLTNAVGSTGGSVTLNWDNSNIQTLTLTSNITTLTKSNPIDGAVYTLFLTQGGTGGKTVSWGTDVEWPGGTPPTLSTAAGSVDAVSLVYIAGVTGYYGNANLNFS